MKTHASSSNSSNLGSSGGGGGGGVGEGKLSSCFVVCVNCGQVWGQEASITPPWSWRLLSSRRPAGEATQGGYRQHAPTTTTTIPRAGALPRLTREARAALSCSKRTAKPTRTMSVELAPPCARASFRPVINESIGSCGGFTGLNRNSILFSSVGGLHVGWLSRQRWI